MLLVGKVDLVRVVELIDMNLKYRFKNRFFL